jgi:hypothetical protein
MPKTKLACFYDPELKTVFAAVRSEKKGIAITSLSNLIKADTVDELKKVPCLEATGRYKRMAVLAFAEKDAQ